MNIPEEFLRLARNAGALALGNLDTDKSATTHQEVQIVLDAIIPMITDWTRHAALKEAEDAVAALLVDPTIYTSLAVVGVINAQTAVHALRSLAEGEQP